jgi:hypothetical protein
LLADLTGMVMEGKHRPRSAACQAFIKVLHSLQAVSPHGDLLAERPSA